MRKNVMLLSLVLAVSLICGCSASGYELIEENGDYYILLENSEPPSVFVYTDDPNVHFDSLAELKRDITGGYFSDEEMTKIHFFKWDDQGRIPIFNLDNLWEGTFPDGVKLNCINWNSDSYYMELMGEDGTHVASISSCSGEVFAETISRYSNFEQTEDAVKSQTSDRNATVYTYASTDGELRCVYYTIEQNGKSLHIWERYKLSDSAEVPSYVEICGSDNGRYFTVNLKKFQERPSVEWLAEWGIKDYSSTGDVVKMALVITVPVVALVGIGTAVLLCRRKNCSKS